MEKIIAEITEAMKVQGLSETRLAALAGMNQKRVNNLLAGRTRRLDMAVIDKLRQTLDMGAAPLLLPASTICGICPSVTDDRLTEIIRLWPQICPQQKNTVLEVVRGFTKPQDDTLPTNGGAVPDFQVKKSA